MYVSQRFMDPSDELELLMARYVAGEIEAFEALYAHVAPRVFAYLVSMCRDRARADDLCQTTFLKIHRARGGWIHGAAVMPWVMAIARNCLLDEVRQHVRSRTDLTATGDVPEVPSSDDPGKELSDKQQSELLSEVMAGALDGLRAPHREALLLTKQSGLSHREAALVLGTTETAVKLRVHRAYQSLRAALKRSEEA